MPFKSQSQARACFAKKSRGQAKGWNCKEWASATKSIKALPEHSKKAMDMSFSKIAKELFDPKKNPPLPAHEIQKQNIAAAKEEKSKGMSPVEFRNKNVTRNK